MTVPIRESLDFHLVENWLRSECTRGISRYPLSQDAQNLLASVDYIPELHDPHAWKMICHRPARLPPSFQRQEFYDAGLRKLFQQSHGCSLFQGEMESLYEIPTEFLGAENCLNLIRLRVGPDARVSESLLDAEVEAARTFVSTGDAEFRRALLGIAGGALGRFPAMHGEATVLSDLGALRDEYPFQHLPAPAKTLAVYRRALEVRATRLTNEEAAQLPAESAEYRERLMAPGAIRPDGEYDRIDLLALAAIGFDPGRWLAVHGDSDDGLARDVIAEYLEARARLRDDAPDLPPGLFTWLAHEEMLDLLGRVPCRDLTPQLLALMPAAMWDESVDADRRFARPGKISRFAAAMTARAPVGAVLPNSGLLAVGAVLPNSGLLEYLADCGRLGEVTRDRLGYVFASAASISTELRLSGVALPEELRDPDLIADLIWKRAGIYILGSDFYRPLPRRGPNLWDTTHVADDLWCPELFDRLVTYLSMRMRAGSVQTESARANVREWLIRAIPGEMLTPERVVRCGAYRRLRLADWTPELLIGAVAARESELAVAAPLRVYTDGACREIIENHAGATDVCRRAKWALAYNALQRLAAGRR